jgi:hypothetical protein
MNKEELLPILREMGYKPFNLAIWDGDSKHPVVGNTCELVGYPFVENNDVWIMIRTRIGDSTSMVKVLVNSVHTVEYMASEIRRLTVNALIGPAAKVNELAARLEHLGSMICNHRSVGHGQSGTSVNDPPRNG